MTKLEELEAAWGAALAAEAKARAATKAAWEAALAAEAKARAATKAAWEAALAAEAAVAAEGAAWDAYHAELKKQEENPNE
jgi:hypothetical protein